MAVPACAAALMSPKPALCRRSAVGNALSLALRCSFYDGDDFHSAASIGEEQDGVEHPLCFMKLFLSQRCHSLSLPEKMKSGVPLDDADRWPWLDSLAVVIERHASRLVRGLN